MPKKDAKEAKLQPNAAGFNESAAMFMKNDAVIGSQKQ
jgi:hypothetical protein